MSRNWHVFHIIVKEGSFQHGSRAERFNARWRELLGQNVIMMTDHTKMAEIIISTIEVTEGRDKEEVEHSWSGDTSIAVREAIKGLAPAGTAGTGPVAL